MPSTASASPLVSVIIPCYNHAHFLQAAVESVWLQHYPAVEIIVVDDGSQDHTRDVATRLQGVIYIHQENAGLSAARNTGIHHSTGELLVFLDADDWLLPGALETNAAYLAQHPAAAFVSGGHDKVYTDSQQVVEEGWEVPKDHYLHLLRGNYIGMHAAVMYRRWVFDQLRFDPSLKSCEDYDVYLKVARKYPVLHHTRRMAAYRLHSTNMSSNIPRMLNTTLQVLDRQKPYLASVEEHNALREGHKVWKEYYGNALYQKLRKGKKAATKSELETLYQHTPSLFFRYMVAGTTSGMKTLIKKNMPAFGLRWLHRLGFLRQYSPALGKVDAGDFERTLPLSKDFGYDRGGPIDRYYLENFLQQEAAHIHGNVLEIGGNEYTLMFGGNKVRKSDILHVDDSNPQATYVGDLSNAAHLPDAAFDCIILTQTLHLIYDYKAALATCYRMLKPGGTFLMTSPGITSIAYGAWKETWFWSFTKRSLQRTMEETFPRASLEIDAKGNVYAATNFLWGLGLPEVDTQKLDQTDEHYQVIITVKATKALPTE